MKLTEGATPSNTQSFLCFHIIQAPKRKMEMSNSRKARALAVIFTLLEMVSRPAIAYLGYVLILRLILLI